MTQATQIDSTLLERGNRYGEFKEHARITQNIKRSFSDSPNWSKLSDSQKEGLEMVAHKIGRILNGDANYIDSWHDIIGYTRLVEVELEAAQIPEPTPYIPTTTEIPTPPPARKRGK